MKACLLTLGAVITFGSFTAASQTSTGANLPATPATPSTENPSLPPGLERRQELPPGLQNREQLPSGLANQAGNLAIQDRAVTQSDQSLLVRIRQTVEPRVQAKGPWTPVHFDVQNGVVTLIGTVETVEIKQQVEALVQLTPGVVRVVDQLVVGAVPQSATTQDQSLLLRVRQTVLPQIQVGGMPVPVDFSVQQGLVTITGTVPTIEQKRLLIALVQQVPGVLQVSDQTVINRSPGPGSAQFGAGQNKKFATPASTNNLGIITNLTPTGRPLPSSSQ